nr:M6 family metalloprotease domain-containing protein [Candidatus Njordarchaeota archaeon]
MTSSRTALTRYLSVIVLLSTVLLVSASPTLLATAKSQVPITDSIATNDHSGFSSVGAALAHPVGSFSAGLQPPTLTNKKAPSQVEKMLVLKAKLLGKDFTTSMAQINTTMSTDVKHYYEEVSYNKTIIVATIIPVNYTMPESESYYGEDNIYGTEPHVEELVNSTLYAAKSAVDLVGNYSVFKHIIIVHSGEDQAMPPNAQDDIMSQFIYREHAALFTIDGVKIMNACVVSDQDPLGVIVHELGHSMGLPDLYDYSMASLGTGDDFIGSWDLMAEGSWNPSGQGTFPSHPTTWCKIKLGWIALSKITQITQHSIQNGYNATVLLSPQELANGTLAIKIVLNNGSYYLVEARQKIGYDAALPSAGVLVLYCDDSKPSGEGPVRLMSDHPPDLGALAPYNVGVLGYNDFFGDKGADIGVKILNKWINGTFKILVGQWTAVLNAPSEYISITSIPVIIVIVACAAFLVVVLIIYVKRGRQKTVRSHGTVPVIKLS